MALLSLVENAMVCCILNTIVNNSREYCTKNTNVYVTNQKSTHKTREQHFQLGKQKNIVHRKTCLTQLNTTQQTERQKMAKKQTHTAAAAPKLKATKIHLH